MRAQRRAAASASAADRRRAALRGRRPRHLGISQPAARARVSRGLRALGCAPRAGAHDGRALVMAELPMLEALGEEFRRLPPAAGTGVLPRTGADADRRRPAGAAPGRCGHGGDPDLARRTAPGARTCRTWTSNGMPLPASARLAGLDVPDPEPAAPPWDMRHVADARRRDVRRRRPGARRTVSASSGSTTCSGRCRSEPSTAAASTSGDGPHAGWRARTSSAPRPAKRARSSTGLAGGGARSVTAYGTGRPARRLKPGSAGKLHHRVSRATWKKYARAS